jgi:Ca-activated chloride channel homolog
MKQFFLIMLLSMPFGLFAQTASILRGNEFYKAGQFNQAEIQYRKALETDPNNATAIHNLANALYKQGKYEDAVKLNGALAKAAKDHTSKSVAYYNQGVSYTKLNNLEASIDSYKNALRQNPDDQQARENLQKALLQLKKQQQQDQKKQQKQNSDMSQKEADQKLKQLQQREKELQQKLNQKNQGGGQAQDW